MKVIATVPKGYRKLRLNEIVRKGDKFSNINENSFMNAESTVRFKLKNVIGTFFPGTFFIRKINK